MGLDLRIAVIEGAEAATISSLPPARPRDGESDDIERVIRPTRVVTVERDDALVSQLRIRVLGENEKGGPIWGPEPVVTSQFLPRHTAIVISGETCGRDGYGTWLRWASVGALRNADLTDVSPGNARKIRRILTLPDTAIVVFYWS